MNTNKSVSIKPYVTTRHGVYRYLNGYVLPILSKHNQYKARLKFGLFRLQEKYVAKICCWCDGTTKATKSETCDICDGVGLLQGNEPAPTSVVIQVLEAGEYENISREQVNDILRTLK